MAEQTVTLNPNESKVVSFEATPNEAKTYNVSVNGLTASFKAITAVGTTLSGVITDAGAGIGGVSITFYQYITITETKSYETTSNGNGFYFIADVVPNVLGRIVCEGEGYQTTAQQLRTIQGKNELNIQMIPIEALKGFITLYMTGVTTQEWMAGWYYADRDKFIANPEYTTPSGYPTAWARPSQPCHPPEPIDLDNLKFKIYTYSEVTKCPKTGYYGTCMWGVFGPFVVEDGGVYTFNISTGALSKR